jgi:hypothetical protein
MNYLTIMCVCPTLCICLSQTATAAVAAAAAPNAIFYFSSLQNTEFNTPSDHA